MRIGIVLAGGEASRLPNKPLLPSRDGGLVIESALAFCARCCNRTIVVVPHNGVLETVLRRARFDVAYAVQDKPTGVADAVLTAISQNSHHLTGDRYLVTFCDNWYGRDVPLPAMDKLLADQKSYASTAVGDHDYGQASLDAFCPARGWVRREHVEQPSVPRFAGWWDLSSHDVAMLYRPMEVPRSDLMATFNALGVEPVAYTRREWRDLGTVEGYKAHWEGL